MPGLRIANPEIFALLDKSRTGNLGIHKLKNPDAPARLEAPPKTTPGVAAQDISYRCGHTGQVPDHITPIAAPLYRTWASANLDCLTCHHDAQATAAALDGEAQGLAPLIGTYKQVRWAVTIRRERMEDVAASRAIGSLAARTEKALDKRLAVTDAAWWITYRDVSLTLFAAQKLPRKARA